MIIAPAKGLLTELTKGSLKWRPVTYDGYWDAINLGQGCWESLWYLDEREALEIMTEWVLETLGQTVAAAQTMESWLQSPLGYSPEQTLSYMAEWIRKVFPGARE